jgi:hypothetical protein
VRRDHPLAQRLHGRIRKIGEEAIHVHVAASEAAPLSMARNRVNAVRNDRS